ncbi:unnamed protein product [Allacma fusca]|uniref:Uncharacterized protein n=1 Tax=Allacma fusca TaxID=39272 RepID=A0A8J2KD35_9HEXA|nr:unnamed protein product [Allacma fusca]
MQPRLPNGSGVQFSVDTDIMLSYGRKRVTIEFDLLPAYDFSSNVDDQTRAVLERLRASWNLERDILRRGRDLFLPGKSPIIELIAIKAAELSNGDILNAFRKFLTLMEGMNRININFSNQDRYPFAVMKIVDAVNPYCNFADGLDTTHVNNFVTRASDTLKALDRVENSGYGFHDSNALKDFMDFFATAA